MKKKLKRAVIVITILLVGTGCLIACSRRVVAGTDGTGNHPDLSLKLPDRIIHDNKSCQALRLVKDQSSPPLQQQETRYAPGVGTWTRAKVFH